MNALARLLSVFIPNQRELLYSYAKTQIGQKLSGVKAPIEFGCVEAFENVFYGCFGRNVQVGLGTESLYNALNSSNRFRKLGATEQALRGDVIISPTGSGIVGSTGHVGIISDSGKIMSNNSLNGFWDEHLDISIWISRYVVGYKMPLCIFRIVI